MPRSVASARLICGNRLVVVGVALILLVSLNSCADGGSAGRSGRPTGPVEKTRIRVGTLPVVDMGPFYLAIEKGYFKEEGLDVQPVVGASGQANITALIGGDLDI